MVAEVLHDHRAFLTKGTISTGSVAKHPAFQKKQHSAKRRSHHGCAVSAKWHALLCSRVTETASGPAIPRASAPPRSDISLLTAVYWINRPAGRLYVLDIIWLG
ncbi:hypothetical protein GCM10009647_089180 [Streptomyces sanglieri]